MELKFHSHIYLQGTASRYSVELARHVTNPSVYSVFLRGILIIIISSFALRSLPIGFFSSDIPHKILDAFLTSYFCSRLSHS
jgi:hypothetical protein